MSSLRCKKCGMRFGKHTELEITNDPNGYYCHSCNTLHSWTDGKPEGVSKFLVYKSNLGARDSYKIPKGGEMR